MSLSPPVTAGGVPPAQVATAAAVHRPRRRAAALALTTAALTAFALAPTGTAQAAPSGPTALYIVQFAGAPLASYAGGVSGFAPTRPANGKKLDAHTPAARAYGDHLKSHQRDVLHSAGVDTGRTVYQYATTFNGAAVNLTAAQAQKVANQPGVLAVFKNRTLTIDTPVTPEMLGMTGARGVWKRQFGGDNNAGNGIIIADIDTGFWPESPSFAALPEPRNDDSTIEAKWHGSCDAGLTGKISCNNKVIGARWFDATGLTDNNPSEYQSPRDSDGHGSHTASTAAGRHVDDVSINGTAVDDVEGMAPGARLAIYKALYEKPDRSGAAGTDADLVAAIDQAVTDGADVINFSVGDSVDTFGPEELAFLQAAAAGVFVSAAAGNDGPGASTIDNAMPWETTVAAGTHDRSYTKTVTLGNGKTYSGVGVGVAVPSTPLIDATDAPAAGHTSQDASLCIIGALDPTKVTGKIVLCERGVNARLDKSKAVKQAGGVGMIQWNPSPNSLNADFHVVPSIHVDTPTGQAIKDYIAGTADPTAALSAGTETKVEAPKVADFSSRGPTLSSHGDLLKPDIMAPGNDVIAAVSPAGHDGNLYDTESGTSMATPHIAGIAALIMSKHPDWSPMWVKSAIMTTAVTTDNKGKPIGAQSGGTASPLDYGAGWVTPARAFDPGLVYDSTLTNWLQFSCGIGVHLTSGGADVCDQVGSIAPNQLNYPSISFGALAGTGTVTRTVTNVSRWWSLYIVDIKAPKGFKVKVNHPVLLVGPGRSASYTVTVTRTTAALGTYAFGSLTWRDFAGHRVTSPIAVQPVPLAVAGSVTGTGTGGSVPIKATAGYTGTLAATGYGLTADTVDHLSLSSDPSKPFDPNNPQVTDRSGRVDITVPAGTRLARVATSAGDYAAGTDLDVFVYAVNDDGTLGAQVGQSAGSTATESATLPGPGKYAVFVDVFTNPSSNPLDVLLHSWLVGSTNAGNFTVSPASQSVSLGGSVTVTASWTGLSSGHSYLGVVEYGDGTSVTGSTVVSVTP